jgi:uncharacterized protein (TIGR02118 family)
MMKLIALFAPPDDAAEFERHYTAVHLPLLRLLPGLVKVETTRITGMPVGDRRFFLLTELYFESKEKMESALASKEGKSFSRDLLAFGESSVTVFSGETE